MTIGTGQDHTPAVEAALLLAEQAYTAANPLSRMRHERAVAVLPGGHSRDILSYTPFPLTMAAGNHARITDLDGHDYLDMVGDYAAGIYGHRCVPIQQAVAETLDGGVCLSSPNTKELELAELISRRIPSMEQLRFCNSGSEACLFAVQAALHATNRAKLLVFDGCCHGAFLNYRSATAMNVAFDVIKATYNDIAGTRAVLRSERNDLAAVIVEPMLAHGVIPAKREFLAMLRDETRRLGIVLIFDEVMTSLLAPGGVQGLRGIDPDLTALGKSWGGGFAFGAFGGSRTLMRHFDTAKGGLLVQGGTFNGNVIAMSAGLVGARDVYTPEACIKLNSLGDSLRLQLNALGRSVGLSFHATGLGSVLSTHWNESGMTEPSRVEPGTAAARRLFQLEMIARGYFVSQRGMIALSVPMTAREVKAFVAEVRAYLTRHADILPRSNK